MSGDDKCASAAEMEIAIVSEALAKADAKIERQSVLIAEQGDANAQLRLRLQFYERMARVTFGGPQ